MVLKMVSIDLPLLSFSSRGDQEKSLPNGATSGQELFHTQPQERLCEQTHKTQFMHTGRGGFSEGDVACFFQSRAIIRRESL